VATVNSVDIVRLHWGDAADEALFVEASPDGHRIRIQSVVGRFVHERTVERPLSLRELADLLRQSGGGGWSLDGIDLSRLRIHAPLYPKLAEMLTTPGLWP
jgi:hypothetical protein